MIKDYIIPAAIIGILADILKIAINYAAYLLNFIDFAFWQIVAARFLPKTFLHTYSAFFIGGVADLTISALLGIAFVYFIYIFGSKHLIIKGIGFGLVVWVTLFGTLLGQSVEGKLPQTPSLIIVTIIAHAAFGLGLSLLTTRLQFAPSKEAIKRRALRLTPSPAFKRESHVNEKHVNEKHVNEKHMKKPIKIEKIKRW